MPETLPVLTFSAGSHVYRLDGQPIPSVTTILGNGFPKPALSYWAADTVARAAVDDWDTLTGVGPIDRYELLRKAPWTKRDEAAFRGTELHAIGEALADGRPVEVPAQYEGIATRYARWLDDWDVQPVALERAVVNVDLRYAGTFDLVADLGDGLRWLLDIKTGKSVYDSHALQLAGYRYATHMAGDDGALVGMPAVDRAAVVHVTPDDVRLVPVSADPYAWRAFRAAAVVAQFAADCKTAWRRKQPWPVGVALDPPNAA